MGGAGPLIVGFVVVVIIGAGVLISLLQYRKLLREAKIMSVGPRWCRC